MSEIKDRFTFVVSDDSLNKYGSRVITGGIDLTEFKKNPVMFWNHKRDEDGLFGSSARDRMPIGKWENIRQDGERLLADAVLDLNDNTGKKVAEKITNGFLQAASIGISVMGFSEDPDDMTAGQTRPTITKSNLLEISIVDIPANGNALKLYYTQESKTLCLGFDDSNNINKIFNNMTTENKTVGEQITLALNGFFDKFKTQFNISPKEEAQIEDTEAAQAALFSEFNATINSIEFTAPTDHTAQIETLSASIEKLNADNAKQSEQIESMKGEIIEFRGKKGGEVSTNDMAPISDKANKDEPIDKEAAKLQAAGEYFKNKFKNH